MDNYKKKYLKYKNKYYNLKKNKMSGGSMYEIGSMSLIALILLVAYYMQKKPQKISIKNDDDDDDDDDGDYGDYVPIEGKSSLTPQSSSPLSVQAVVTRKEGLLIEESERREAEEKERREPEKQRAAEERERAEEREAKSTPPKGQGEKNDLELLLALNK